MWHIRNGISVIESPVSGDLWELNVWHMHNGINVIVYIYIYILGPTSLP